MISSQIDSNIGKKEFELLYDQEHMEEVWTVMQRIKESVEFGSTGNRQIRRPALRENTV